MIARSGNLTAQRGTSVAVVGVALSILMVVSSAGWSQTAPPQGPPSQPGLGLPEPAQQSPTEPSGAPSPQPVPEDNPGLINEMGKLFKKSLSILPPLKSPSETIDDLNARAKNAGEAISNLAKPSMMVTGRLICPVSANGAPDCKSAADKLCQGKGYKEGKSLTTDSSESCSAKVLIPGRQRQPGDCRTDNFVTRALCR